MAALQYLESLRNAHPDLDEWYNSLAALYHKKLWHQLTLKLNQFIGLAISQKWKWVSLSEGFDKGCVRGEDRVKEGQLIENHLPCEIDWFFEHRSIQITISSFETLGSI